MVQLPLCLPYWENVAGERAIYLGIASTPAWVVQLPLHIPLLRKRWNFTGVTYQYCVLCFYTSQSMYGLNGIKVEWHYRPSFSTDCINVMCNCDPGSGKRGHCQPLTLHNTLTSQPRNSSGKCEWYLYSNWHWLHLRLPVTSALLQLQSVLLIWRCRRMEMSSILWYRQYQNNV